MFKRKNSISSSLKHFLCPVVASAALAGCSQDKASTAEADIDLTQVKSYLVATVNQMHQASQEFVANATAYAALIKEHNGDYAAAAKDPRVAALITKMQDDYKQMDSFGYETVEGIVAGVPSLAQYDVDLDAGNKGEDGPDDVAQVTFTLADGTVVDKQGNFFTHHIEPTLWGGDSKWITPVDLNGNGKLEARESLPNPMFLEAVSKAVDTKIASLQADANAWQPTAEDCFGAMITMTPTLSEYFEDWKESRYGNKQSGLFYAVSRVSDMRGIMSSCAVIYTQVNPAVNGVDPALASSIKEGFDSLDVFLVNLKEQENKGEMTAAEIDEYARQAKEKTDKLVPQIEQAAALLEIQPAS